MVIKKLQRRGGIFTELEMLCPLAIVVETGDLSLHV